MDSHMLNPFPLRSTIVNDITRNGTDQIIEENIEASYAFRNLSKNNPFKSMLSILNLGQLLSAQNLKNKASQTKQQHTDGHCILV